MTDTTPRLTITSDDQGAWALLQGRWGAAELGQRKAWQALQKTLQACGANPAQGWDLEGLQWLDHVGAQLLWNHWQHAWPQKLRLTDGQRAMLTRVASFQQAPAPPRKPWSWMDQVNQLGLLVLHALDHLSHLVELVGQLAMDFWTLLSNPRKGPWRDFSGHLYSMGATALPIT
ncbi:MAG: ABC transporter permease, partial [Comamonas sp.]|nr:ABC transporter permease [Comamonas sp.]